MILLLNSVKIASIIFRENVNLINVNSNQKYKYKNKQLLHCLVVFPLCSERTQLFALVGLFREWKKELDDTSSSINSTQDYKVRTVNCIRFNGSQRQSGHNHLGEECLENECHQSVQAKYQTEAIVMQALSNVNTEYVQELIIKFYIFKSYGHLTLQQ